LHFNWRLNLVQVLISHIPTIPLRAKIPLMLISAIPLRAKIPLMLISDPLLLIGQILTGI
jgi:hypothetical protein